MHWWPWPSSVCLSVCPMPDHKSRMEGNRIASWKLAGRKPMTRVTRDPIQRSKGQRSRSPGRLIPWQKTLNIFGTGRPTSIKLGVWMEYGDPHHWPAPRWPWRSKVNLLVHCSWLFQSPLAGGGGILWRPHYRPHNLFLHCALSLAAQCIVIGPVCLFATGGPVVSVTMISRNCMHRSSPNWVSRCR